MAANAKGNSSSRVSLLDSKIKRKLKLKNGMLRLSF
jgi:hypothetical protein